MRKLLSYINSACLIAGAFFLTMPSVAAATPAADYVYMIVTVNPPPQRNVRGTAFVLYTADRGQVFVTNKHICMASSTHRYAIVSDDADGDLYETTDFRIATHDDLCLIGVPRSMPLKPGGLRAAKRNQGPSLTESVRTIGFPGAQEKQTHFGRITYLAYEPADLGAVAFVGEGDFKVLPGASGSPVLNSKDEVVGVVFAYEIDTGRGVFVPVSELNKLLEAAR